MRWMIGQTEIHRGSSYGAQNGGEVSNPDLRVSGRDETTDVQRTDVTWIVYSKIE